VALAKSLRKKKLSKFLKSKPKTSTTKDRKVHEEIPLCCVRESDQPGKFGDSRSIPVFMSIPALPNTDSLQCKSICMRGCKTPNRVAHILDDTIFAHRQACSQRDFVQQVALLRDAAIRKLVPPRSTPIEKFCTSELTSRRNLFRREPHSATSAVRSWHRTMVQDSFRSSRPSTASCLPNKP
jgi:hypothetical protein